jgi:serine/threonine protein kinase
MLLERVELAAGQMFREMKIVKVLGRGGMGVVYLAEHVLLKQPRALKFLGTEGARENPLAVQRFLREAQRASELGFLNPHIVKTLDMGQDEKYGFFIAMEYVDGPSLASLIEGAPQGLPVERALEIVRGIASGLVAAHAKGMVHRDIKPGNILLGMDDEGREIAKIADFGIVTGGEEESRLTRTGVNPLTPQYAAPEQWRGVRELDGRADLYALGCLFFEMLTGSAPFDGESGEDLRQRHLMVPVPTPSLVRAELGRWVGLDAVVMRMMAKAREHRPGDVKAFLAELDGVTGPGIAAAPVVPAPPPRVETQLELGPVGIGKAGFGKARPVPPEPVPPKPVSPKPVTSKRGQAGGGIFKLWRKAKPEQAGTPDVRDLMPVLFERRPRLAWGGLVIAGMLVVAVAFDEFRLTSWSYSPIGVAGVAGVIAFFWGIVWLILRKLKRTRNQRNGLTAWLIATGIPFFFFQLAAALPLLGSDDLETAIRKDWGMVAAATLAGIYGSIACGLGFRRLLIGDGYIRVGLRRWTVFQNALGVCLLLQGAYLLGLLLTRNLLVLSPGLKSPWIGIPALFVMPMVVMPAVTVWAVRVILLRSGYARKGKDIGASWVFVENWPLRWWVKTGVLLALALASGFSPFAGKAWERHQDLAAFSVAKEGCDRGELAACKQELQLDKKLWSQNSSDPLYFPDARNNSEGQKRVTARIDYLSCTGANQHACAGLGDDYADGNGWTKDYPAALWAYEKGCDAGSYKACAHGGALMEADHPNLGRDLSRARRFYVKGCTLGDTDACSKRDRLDAIVSAKPQESKDNKPSTSKVAAPSGFDWRRLEVPSTPSPSLVSHPH